VVKVRPEESRGWPATRGACGGGSGQCHGRSGGASMLRGSQLLEAELHLERTGAHPQTAATGGRRLDGVERRVVSMSRAKNGGWLREGRRKLEYGLVAG
jgi:hypothetical protein